MNNNIKADIEQGKTALGIELGSTRIKAVLIDSRFDAVATGGFSWENRLENGVWTYRLDDVWAGVQESFRALCADVREKHGVELENIGKIGISGMMHGYLAVDNNGELLTPFKTWRNTDTEEAAKLLTAEFGVNVPIRWTVSHLFQAVMNSEPHVNEICFVTTLAGYVHYKLTGERILGVGEASGVFPIDSTSNDYNQDMIDKFDKLIDKKYPWTLRDIFFEVKPAGSYAGDLTEEGAALLDPTGKLKAGIPLCPPEGDAGTGMVATNSVAERTGNVSAGTSIFAMMVLEKALSGVYPEIDMVTTPAGKPVAMVHCNNCTSDIDAWVRLLSEAIGGFADGAAKADIYDFFYKKALEGEADAGGILSYNYLSGEPTTGFDEGRPLLLRLPDAELSLANFARSLIYSAMATLRIGMDILKEREGFSLSELLGHGGFFKTEGVGQRLMAAALGVSISVMESAGEGGAWGIALLAAYLDYSDESLEAFLERRVFSRNAAVKVVPDSTEEEGFNLFLERYKRGLAIERSAVENT